ncbi:MULTISPECIES: serine hydrolase domain-containing protein [Kitasatospora]|uniref:Putative peptidase S12 family protein n=1 Tax=Kitasatospora setae (strain ATCC 33774 / DSM 43861 / JCM 3304 / KCC A-0304 / NBRC 14216 / KM-6054) TaxID=452652 RepID=E4N612_KITSK|nr:MULTISPECIES: serine hydrolase domain-containing protein [Kitasatospora]BAJ26643.1 putative peptidase S12 family protein [Kitasatospora setae KM-6054]
MNGSRPAPLGLALAALLPLACAAAPASVVPASVAPASAVPSSVAPASVASVADLGALVDRTVAEQLRRDRIPGAAVAVVRGDEVLLRGYGLADTAARTPVDPERTGFYLGSLAKLFTAQAAADLVAAGRIDPDADVNRYLPPANRIPDTYPGRPVTTDRLLTHTAGFDSDLVGVNSATPDGIPTLADSLAAHRPARVRPPGTLAAYDNYGAALAGLVVERVAGKPYAEHLHDTVLGPLGMTRTSFAQPHPAALTPARGYRPDGAADWTEEHGQYGPWTPSGPGGLTTAADMARWLRDQLAPGPAARLMQTTHYRQHPRLPGLGWAYEGWTRDGFTGWFKDGDLPGFHGNLLVLPEQHLGVYVVYNGDGTDGTAGWDGKQLIRAIVDTLPGAAAVTGGDTGPVDGGGRYAGTYLAARGSRDSMMRTEELFGAVTVTTADAGLLRTEGLSPDPRTPVQYWRPLGDGQYLERDGQARIAFRDGVLTASDNASTAYRRLGWCERPGPRLAVLGAALAVLLGAAVAVPATALTRRLRRCPAHPLPARAARAAAAVTGLLAAGFLTALLALVADGNAMMEAVPLGTPLALAPTWWGAALPPAALAVTAGATAGWLRGWWRLPGRIAMTATATAAAAFTAFLADYHLIAGPLGTLLG